VWLSGVSVVFLLFLAFVAAAFAGSFVVFAPVLASL